MSNWKQEKVFIPHGGLPKGGALCGILQTRENDVESSGSKRKIALVGWHPSGIFGTVW
jgi:hypothetical protein